MRMRPRQRGFTLVAAIFIIVVLASLAIFMASLAGSQRATSTLSIVGARAYFAAQSGMEWGVAQVLAGGACFASPASFTLAGGMTSGFDVRVSCSATAVSEGAATYNVYRLQVLASRGAPNKEDYFSRTLVTTVTDAP